MEEFYVTLGCSSCSSTEDIKLAYQRLLLKYHPDKNMNACSAEDKELVALKFHRLQQAFKVLGD